MKDDRVANRDRYRRNLDQLMRRIGEIRANDPELNSRFHRNQQRAEQMATRMPLSHATGQQAMLDAVVSGRLRSVARMIAEQEEETQATTSVSVEQMLGTDDCVFTYAAPFRYPATSCGFLFGPGIEGAQSSDPVATPFDSGATIEHLRPHDTRDQQVHFLREHELSVPGYRTLLSEVIASTFSNPVDYLLGTEPDGPDWIEVVAGDLRRRTFEVRFVGQMPLVGHLLAVFFPLITAGDGRILDQLSSWEAEGVEVVVFQVSDAEDAWTRLREVSERYVVDYFGIDADV